MNKYKIATILLSIVSLVLIATTIYFYTNHQIEYSETVKNDTIVIKSIDTITIEKTNISYRDVIVLDTIYIADTALFVEQKVYCDSISTIHFQGINAFIDSIEYRLPKDTLIVNKEIIQTIQQKENFWHNRFTISAGIFCGYGLTTHKPDVFVGVGCAIRLY